MSYKSINAGCTLEKARRIVMFRLYHVTLLTINRLYKQPIFISTSCQTKHLDLETKYKNLLNLSPLIDLIKFALIAAK